MPRGKNISVFLMDGTATGKIKATITNWDGIAYRIPRDLLQECKDFEAFKKSGVYCLFGYRNVYIGQAEVRKSGAGIYQRILDHESDKLKNSWDEVVVFTKKDNSFGRTDISYLENRFYNRALSAKRYSVLNSVEPTIGTVTEEKEAELEEFIDQAELILGALGYRLFEPISTSGSLWGSVDEPGTQSNQEENHSSNTATCQLKPQLPPSNIKIGEYIKAAFKNLESSYTFSPSDLEILESPEKSREVFSLNARESGIAVLKRYDSTAEAPHIVNGHGRYYAPTPNKRGAGFLLHFNGNEYMLTKEWYETNRVPFDKWYAALP